MQRKEILIMMVTAGILLAVTAGLWLVTAPPANAQCGSQASSCKNCHEVQGQMPVNNDGTGWHSSHAFGDFCYICHAGNNQATDITDAHTGMVPPLSDIKASCQQCHPNDLTERAQVYASALGVEIGNSTPADAPIAPVTEVESSTGDITAVSMPIVTELDVDDPNLVDYTQRYNEIVLGKKSINTGNAILIGLIGLLALGGGGFVIKNEGWFDLSAIDTKAIEGEYASDVVDMLPAISELKPASRKALSKILRNPNGLEKVLKLIDSIVMSENCPEDKQ